MFRSERNRALFMLVCSFAPLCFELVAGGDMVSLIEWNIGLSIFLYTCFVFQASSCKDHTSSRFHLYVECAKLCLLLSVVHCWLDFFHNMQQGLVTCVLMDAKAMTANLNECQENGLVSGCVHALQFLNTFNRAVSKCPQVVLGNFVGKLYIAIVLCFRFINVGLLGVWNLYSWNLDRFISKSNESIKKDSSSCTRTPSTKYMCGMLLLLLPCLVVEAAIPHVIPLSNINVMVIQMAVFGLQYIIKMNVHDKTVKNTLLNIQKVVVITAIFYTVTDFVMQCIKIIFSCIANDLMKEDIMKTCSNAHSRQEIEQCYSMLEYVNPSFYTSETCPHASGQTAPVATLYIANAIKLIVLSVGNTIVFFSKKTTKEMTLQD